MLILGETGTGKEILARTIHERGSCREAPFIAQNCAAIPHELAESELFGHKSGAFSGALRDKPGIIELAHRGTLFLDEIAELSTALQAKLLRVLDGGQLRRIGDVFVRNVEFRLVCATNRDINLEVREGRFRRDLFYRINFFSVKLPPLSMRPGDIPELALYFLERAARRTDESTPEISDAAMQALCAHRWPGNVRELQNIVERAAILAGFRRIELAHLQLAPDDFNAPVQTSRVEVDLASSSTNNAMGNIIEPLYLPPADGAPLNTLPQAIRAVERDLARDALLASKGNLSAAARALGITRQKLQLLVRKYQLPRPRRSADSV